MKTITLQIGNTDNKLTQQEWAEFAAAVESAVQAYAEQVHFAGASHGTAKWQNACWVVACEPGDEIELFKRHMERVRADFRQQSVAWTEGETVFI